MIDLLIPLEGFWDGVYGLLSTMMQPLYWAVSGIVVLFHAMWSPLFGRDSGVSWTLAIVCLTVLIRTLLIPLFIRQIESARSMQLLAPKMRELQKKYGHDRQRMAEEQMKLYQAEGVNPAASCLPLLLQMPIFLALFRVLQGVADGQVRGYWFKRNPDLVESLQNADLFGARLSGKLLPISPFGPTQLLAIVLVVLMVATLFITQLQLMRKNMPPESLTGPMAQQQKLMLYLFPVLYAASAVVIPNGVLIYWLTTNLWTMAQQGILIRNNPAPNTPAFVDWEERMRQKGKDPKELLAQREAKRRGKRRRPADTNPRGSGATAATAEKSTESGKTSVTRQQSTRQVVRSGDGTQVVRRQPKSQSRAARKKK